MSLAMQKVDASLPVRTVQTARSLFESPGFAVEVAKLLQKTIPKDFFLRVALNALQRQPKLLECDGRSLCGALMECAQLGLAPRGPYGMWLVPFKNKKTGRTECNAIIDYRALKNKVIEAGAAESISAALVYAGDDFEHQLGDEPSLHHSPKFQSTDDADILYAYAIAWLPDGNRAYAVLSRDMIDHARSRSKAQDYIWATDYGEMAKKTAIRRLCKMLFIPQNLFATLDADEARETLDMGDAIDIAPVQEASEQIDAPSTPIDQLRRGPGRPRKMETQARPQAPPAPPVQAAPVEREAGDEPSDPEIEAAFGGQEVRQ